MESQDSSPFSLSVFAHPERWLFTSGFPGQLEDSRWWVRGGRATMVLTFLAMISGIFLVFIESLSFRGMIAHAITGCLEGLIFGLLVILPAARWTSTSRTGFSYVTFGVLIYAPLPADVPPAFATIWFPSAVGFTSMMLCRHSSPRFVLVSVPLSILIGVLAIGVGYDWLGMHDYLQLLVPSRDVCSLVVITQFQALAGVAISVVFWNPAIRRC